MKQRKSNPELRETIRKLRAAARQNDAAAWNTVADALSKPSRSTPSVNLSRINRYADDGDTVVVPGKVLGSGHLDKDVTVIAFQFSDRAKQVIEETGETHLLRNYVEQNENAANVRIMK